MREVGQERRFGRLLQCGCLRRAYPGRSPFSLARQAEREFGRATLRGSFAVHFIKFDSYGFAADLFCRDQR